MKNFYMRSTQSGLSIIELMIAMFIGLFLLAGISSTYLYSKKSSTQRDELSILEDNGRLALEILSKTIQHTGYTSSIGFPIEKFITASNPVQSKPCTSGNSVKSMATFSEASIVANNNDAAVSTNASDTIGVVFLGDDSVTTDCAGGPLPSECQITSTTSSNPTETAAARIFNTFYLKDSAVGRELKCAGSGSDAAVTIADGVENMQILYGINADSSSDRSVERYVNADDVGNLWSNVTSVKIALLMRSEKPVKDTAEQQKFTLLDAEVTSPNDRFHRAVYSTTISLRN